MECILRFSPILQNKGHWPIIPDWNIPFLSRTLLKRASRDGVLSTVKLLLRRGARADLDNSLHLWTCQHIRLGTNLLPEHMGIGKFAFKTLLRILNVLLISQRHVYSLAKRRTEHCQYVHPCRVRHLTLIALEQVVYDQDICSTCDN